MSDCETCRLIERRDQGRAAIWDSMIRTDNFDIVHANNSTLLGWTVIVVRRHLSSITDLNENEAGELGTLIHRVSCAIQIATECEKTYVMQFAEAPGHSHVHFHVVPRMAGLPEAHKGANIFHYLGASPADRLPETAMNQFAETFFKYYREF